MTDEELVGRVQALVEQHADGIYQACERGIKCPDDLARAIIPIVARGGLTAVASSHWRSGKSLDSLGADGQEVGLTRPRLDVPFSDVSAQITPAVPPRPDHPSIMPLTVKGWCGSASLLIATRHKLGSASAVTAAAWMDTRRLAKLTSIAGFDKTHERARL